MENRVFLAKCDEYETEKVRCAVHNSLEAFGGAKELAGGKRVLIKVNLLMTSAPEKAVTTHPAVVDAIAREFVDAGCTVEIADSCGGLYTEEILKRLYVVSGMKKVADDTGATLNYDLSSFERSLPNGVKLNKVKLISPVERAEFIISAAKLKTHGFTYYTGAVKNMFGTVPGLLKAAMHRNFPDKKAFCEAMVDLCEGVRPDLAIIDGIIGMEGAGPSGGTPKFAGAIITSKSPYAADLVGLQVMGLDPEKSYIHTTARSRGLVGDVVCEGTEISEVKTNFEPAYTREPRTVLAILPGALRTYVERIFAAYPNVINAKCVGCGECVRSCPESTITIEGGKAHIGYKKCIRCYCCQEMCPARAIKIERFAKYKKR